MKILHTADSHLGYAAYRKSTEDGINQREKDIYNTFEEFINYAIEKKPDLIIHAGDLFDSVRPNNRAITFAIKQLVKLSKEKISFVLISGNHEQPKLKETGHIFSVFDHIENIYPIYNEEYEKISFEINGNIIFVHALPQCNSKKNFNEQLKKLKPEKNAEYNIFISHGSVTGVKDFTMNEFNELIIPARILSRNFDYIGLGHYHKYTKLGKNAYYPGAIESLTFSEANENKGFIELNLEKNNIKINFIELKTRPMVDSEPIECSELKIDQIMKKIKQQAKKINPKEKTVRITLKDISPNLYRNLDFSDIRKQFGDAIHYEIKVDAKEEINKSSNFSNSKINALANEFKDFLEKQNIEDKKILADMGMGYIEKIEAKKEGK
jgi:DNA repair exonuclease SbcCD nuclease subunit